MQVTKSDDLAIELRAVTASVVVSLLLSVLVVLGSRESNLVILVIVLRPEEFPVFGWRCGF
jgi:hypothetical protein